MFRQVLPVLGMLALGLLERNAEACSVSTGGGGYVTELRVTTEVYPDKTSPQVCEQDVGSCGKSPVYREAKRYLLATPVLGGAPKDGKPNTWLGYDQASFTLKDVAGNVLATTDGYPGGAIFDRLGATVCVKTAAEATPTNVGEVCGPVTITALDYSDADRAAHDADVRQRCPEVKDDDDGGCNASGHGSSSVLSVFLGLGLVVFLRRKKVRHSS